MYIHNRICIYYKKKMWSKLIVKPVLPRLVDYSRSAQYCGTPSIGPGIKYYGTPALAPVSNIAGPPALSQISNIKGPPSLAQVWHITGPQHWPRYPILRDPQHWPRYPILRDPQHWPRYRILRDPSTDPGTEYCGTPSTGPDIQYPLFFMGRLDIRQNRVSTGFSLRIFVIRLYQSKLRWSLYYSLFSDISILELSDGDGGTRHLARKC